ncbi:beta-ketoacyl synthase N-terminal-like domain-containing protein [Paenibacillus piscarius]|uniref:beta-ketoacyl synthase N-terminal-like domain-containing protein n=1 Tax=Paenibacillus piscarius TaxID=1089681 RepID=UPI001EE9A4EA|nr:beta-ketoacyl synthase N-terminal-like domain-containing protein [Paenibacillus piscarius]
MQSRTYAPDRSPGAGHVPREDIAIIGISGRFSGARNVEEYWSNLVGEACSLQEAPAGRTELTRLDPAQNKHIRYAGFLPGADQFDPLFFRMSPKEAEYTDPRQRLFLEESCKAIEDAGYSLQEMSGSRCGIFVGLQQGEYLERFQGEPNEHVPAGNSLSVIAARISYLLNLKGPSIAVDTACSSSLVAVSLACDSLHSGSSEVAVAGGVQLMLTPWIYVSLGKLGMLNTDGRCKPFADEADGIGLGEGVGAVVLKKAASARRDGDHIYGVIKGIGVNQDGKTNGITAPNGLSQAALERGIYESSRINPEHITYVEAHGTGTRLGDPIEVAALTEAFRTFTARKQYCHLGSVKGNIGHTLSASGIAGLIKVLLSMKHGKIPATLHTGRENSLIEFADSPFYVGKQTETWAGEGGRPRMAAVSSFGMSGTNCHLVVAEHLEATAASAGAGNYEEKMLLFALSAKSTAALAAKARNLLEHLQKHPGLTGLADVSYTLLAGRDHYPYRCMFAAASREELIRELEAYMDNRPGPGWFSGGGTGSGERVNPELKGRMELLITQFQQDSLPPQERDQATRLIANYYIRGYDVDFRSLSAGTGFRRVPLPGYPFDYMRCWIEGGEGNVPAAGSAAASGSADSGGGATAGLLHPLVHRNVSTLQGICFETVIEPAGTGISGKRIYGTDVYSEAVLLAMGAQASLLGSGFSGITALERVQFHHPAAALKLKKLRIRLQEEGGTLRFAVQRDGMPQEILAAGTARTGPVHASGAPLSADISRIRREAVQVRSGQEVYRILENQGLAYEEQARGITELYSSLTGHLAVLAPELFHLEDDVLSYRLSEAVLQCLNADVIGIGSTIGTAYEIGEIRFIRPKAAPGYLYFQSGQPDSGSSGLHYEVHVLDESGEEILYYKDIQMVPVSTGGLITREQYGLLAKEWVQSAQPIPPERIEGHYLIIVNQEMDEAALGAIRTGFDSPLILCDGKEHKLSTMLNVNFTDTGNSSQVIEELLAVKIRLQGVIDLSDLHALPMHTSKQSFGKIMLLQALVKQAGEDFRIIHLTGGLQGPEGGTLTLAGADIAGIIRTLSAEYSRIRARTIDIGLAGTDMDKLLQMIRNELQLDSHTAEAAYADGFRFEPVVRLLKQQSRWQDREPQNRLKPDPGKVYVITGGTRGIGAETARLLVRRGARKLVLMGVQAMPARAEWPDLLSGTSHDPGSFARIKRIAELEASGAQVEVYSGSLADTARLKAFMEKIRGQWGEIGGVIHCAGSNRNEHPAFIHKTIADIRQVFEPKVDGAAALGHIIAGDTPDFCILFSSVSALVPLLSAGLSDYSAANYYMDLYAQHQHTLGNTYYQSVLWPSWSEAGMLADSGFQLSPLYTQAGLTAHSLADGLFMLEDLICGNTPPSVIPAMLNMELYRPDLWTQTRLETARAAPGLPGPKSNSGVQAEMSALILDIFCTELKLPRERVREDMPFVELGVDSILLIGVIKKLEAAMQASVDPALFFELRDVSALAAHLSLKRGASAVQPESRLQEKLQAPVSNILQFAEPYSRMPEWSDSRSRMAGEQSAHATFAEAQNSRNNHDGRIAVIGMGCHFPGAGDKDTFWNNLVQGVDSITEIPASRWDQDEYYAPVHTDGKSISKWGGFLDDIESFDGGYFGLKENTEQISPLMRQCLEVTAETLLDAGYSQTEISGRKVGVFIGAHPGSYPGWVQEINKHTIIGIGQNFIAAYASHFYNLKGPSLTVDSACSSSLLSLHLACQSIRSGESEMAIAGGVDLLLDERPHLVFSASRAMSPDGKCHTFDEGANGIVPGEGCGAVLLKPLAQALADGDRIYTVIEASAAGNDGRTMGVTTPNLQAQEEVIAEALRQAGIHPQTIGYVETHGTGTMIGDPIELKALTSVYQKYTAATGFCGVGSVKTNIGHCLSAAGIASFIKTALCVHHRMLVPTLNCRRPNPRFDFGHSPFYPVQTAAAWDSSGEVRRAAVSSFGFGGTNVHMIIGECSESGLQAYTPRRKPLPAPVYNKQRVWTDRLKIERRQAAQEEQDQLSFLQFIEE